MEGFCQCDELTVWKISNFPTYQILREINSWEPELEFQKSAGLTFIAPLDLFFSELVHLCKAKIAKIVIFDLLEMSKFGFT